MGCLQKLHRHTNRYKQATSFVAGGSGIEPSAVVVVAPRHALVSQRERVSGAVTVTPVCNTQYEDTIDLNVRTQWWI